MTRQDVLTEARGWLGTPWHHAACVRGVGVDCVYFPFGVFRALGLLPAGFVMPDYGMTPDGHTLIATCERWFGPAIAQRNMRPADLVVLQPDDRPQHVGLISAAIRPGVFNMIHAARDHGKVIEHRLMFSRVLGFVAAYRLPGMT
jgi:cell wall-associated NlpC family hydrolase